MNALTVFMSTEDVGRNIVRSTYSSSAAYLTENDAFCPNDWLVPLTLLSALKRRQEPEISIHNITREKKKRVLLTKICQSKMSLTIKNEVIGSDKSDKISSLRNVATCALLHITMNIAKFMQRIDRQDHLCRIESRHLFGKLIVVFRQ